MKLKYIQLLLSILIVIIVAVLVALFLAFWPRSESGTVDVQEEATEEIPSVVEPADHDLYFIAIDDNGAAGDLVGCGDSVITTPYSASGADSSLQGALEAEISAEESYGESGLYNPLGAHSDMLTFESVSVQGGVATIRFMGDISEIVHCEVPRFQEQVERTALQFPDVSSVEIYVNRELFTELTDERG